MFSQEPHCTYRKSPLADVICQLRYPEILMNAGQSPAAFQEVEEHGKVTLRVSTGPWG